MTPTRPDLTELESAGEVLATLQDLLEAEDDPTNTSLVESIVEVRSHIDELVEEVEV